MIHAGAHRATILPMSMHTAMILAAGRGERLRPLTDRVPKPLLQVGRYRLIEYHLMSLASIGVHRVVINIAHLAEQIQHTLGDGARYGVEILYSMEPPGALETAGGIRNALPLLGRDPFLVINGDIRCDIRLDGLALEDPNFMHLVLVANPQHRPNGDFGLDRSSIPHRLLPPSGTADSLTYAGVGVFSPEPFRQISEGRSPLAPLIRECIDLKRATGEQYNGYWMDVGNADRLEAARRESG